MVSCYAYIIRRDPSSRFWMDQCPICPGGAGLEALPANFGVMYRTRVWRTHMMRDFCDALSWPQIGDDEGLVRGGHRVPG